MPSEMRIDEEFRALCPPHSDNERDLLRESISSEGIRDSVAVWNGIVLDGHCRVEIGLELRIAIPTTEVALRDREAAKLWILKNQLGRRNLSRIQIGYLRGRYYRMVKQSPGRKPTGESPFCTDGDKQISDVVGALFSVSRCTIMLDAQLSEAIDKMDADARECILSGKVLCYPSHVKQLAEIPFAEQRKIADRIRLGEKNAVADGLKDFAERGEVAHVKCQCGASFRVGSRCQACAKRSLASVSRAVSMPIDKMTHSEHNAVQSIEAEQASFDGWQERLREMRLAGTGNDDLTFWANYVLMWLEEHDKPTEFHIETLEKLIDKCRDYVESHQAAVA